jgi:hypothetical protein
VCVWPRAQVRGPGKLHGATRHASSTVLWTSPRGGSDRGEGGKDESEVGETQSRSVLADLRRFALPAQAELRPAANEREAVTEELAGRPSPIMCRVCAGQVMA